MKADPKKKVTLDIPESLVAKIQKLAWETNRSFSAMVRVLLLEALDNGDAS